MAKNSIDDYSVTPASNSDIDGLDSTGATGLVKSGDNYTRSLMSHLKAKANDDGAVNTVGGTGDAITVTLASNPTALVDGMRFSINAPGTNTGAVTIAVTNSGATLLGTKKVRKWSGGAETALSAGDITSGHIINLVYDSARDTAAGAFMIDGGASVAAATTSAAGIVELATATEALQASSATLAVTPAGLANLYSLALNNAIEIADLKGSRLNMAGGIADAYDSETDVDTATSTNESYDSTNDLYSPTATSGSNQTATHTNYTTSGNTVSASSEYSVGFPALGYAWMAFDKVTGAGSNNNCWVANNVTTGWLQYQFGSAKTIGSYTIRSPNGFPTRAPKTWTLLGSNTGSFSGEQTTLDTRTNETGWTAGGQVRTYTIASPASFTYYRLNVTANDGDGSFLIIDEVTLISADVANNMTLVSNAFTATAVPTVARVAVFIDPQQSITINTDFTAEVSRDGGTTWTAVTLAIVSNPVGTVEQYEGTVSISSQPSGTSMKYRLKTLNNKDIDVTGIVFQWS